jgi:2-hydroxychromene-2-carboxylate isomerase
MPVVTHYFDYKSPYAYLAQEATFALADLPGVSVEWLPYTLDIEKYLGAAALDANGQDTEGTRNAHQWRRVRYSYMDCRREANRRGLVIRGPRRIFDSRAAHAAFLYVRERGDFRPFHAEVFRRFWLRELDLEDVAALTGLIAGSGVDAADFPAWLAGPGLAALSAMQAEAEAAGVFGVPSYLIEGELFWGAERLDRVRECLTRGRQDA